LGGTSTTRSKFIAPRLSMEEYLCLWIATNELDFAEPVTEYNDE